MDPELLKQLQEALNATGQEIKTLLAAQQQEIKAHGETTAATAGRLEAAEKRLDEIGAAVDAAQKSLQELSTEAKRLPTGDRIEDAKSLGHQFVESEAYKAFAARDGQKRSDAFAVKGNLVSMHRKALVTMTGLTAISTQVIPEIVAPGMGMYARVRDLIPVRTTTDSALTFVRETGYTNAAATVAEGDEKPEAAITFDDVALSVQTIAHWLPVTRQAVRDVAQLQGYIDQRLLYGLALTEDDEILYGTGSGSHLAGIMTQIGLQSYNWSDGETGDNRIDAVRRAMTKVLLAEYPATGIVLHPNDWEQIEVLKGSDGHYIWVVVTVGGEKRLWRMPVVECPRINEGTGLIGSFALGATLWDREESAIYISDSHSDFFIRNKLAILAEERLCLTVYRPEAFVKLTFDHAPSGSGSGS